MQARWHCRVGIALVCATCALTPFHGAAAQRSDAINLSFDRVIALPAYCADSQYGSIGRYDPSNYSPSQQHWARLLGSGFHHIHHYCWAVDSANRARNPLLGLQERRALLSSAIKDCAYVVKEVPPDFVLLPEIFLRMGQFSAARGDPAGALEYFDRSRQSKRDYWPAYVEIAKTNLSIGRRQEAEAALRTGLEVIPNAPQLKQALEQMQSASSASKGRRMN